MLFTVGDGNFVTGENRNLDDDNPSQAQARLKLSALPGGGYIAVWVDQASSVGSSIKARFFDNAGNPVGDEFQVSDAPGSGGGGDPTVGVSADGTILIAWIVENPLPAIFDVVARVFDPSGNPIGPEVTVNTNTDGFQVDPLVTALADGNFLVTWLIGSQDGANGQLLDSSGNRVGDEFSVTPGPHNYSRDVVGLEGGGFVAAWYDVLADGSPGITAQMFNADGTTRGTSFPVNTYEPGEQLWPSLAALPGGGFVAAWVDNNIDYGTETGHGGIWLQLFDANGHKLGSEIEASADLPFGQDYSAVEVIADVGILAVWRDSSTNNPDGSTQLRGQLFDFSLNRIGDDFAVASSPTGKYNPQLAALENGNVVVGWWDQAFGSSSDQDVRAQILHATVQGTEASDVMSGTQFADFIIGRSGDDQINGLAGDDYLDGGAGDDVLLGGDGDDFLQGSAGGDTLIGGNGDDTAYIIGGTSAADIGRDIVDLGLFDPAQPGLGAGYDCLIVDFGLLSDQVVMSGQGENDSGLSFGPSGAAGIIRVDGQEKVVFDGVGRLTITTGSADDTVRGLSQFDNLSTGGGNDQIYNFSPGPFTPTATRIDGGSGMDTVHSLRWDDLTANVSFNVNLPFGYSTTTSFGTRSIVNVESFQGLILGSGDDFLTLWRDGSQANTISTGSGNDSVVLYGGATNATTGFNDIDLGNGALDQIISDFSAATEDVDLLLDGAGMAFVGLGGVSVHAYSNFEFLTFTSGSGSDTFDGRSAPAMIMLEVNSGNGDDVLIGGAGADTFVAGLGDDLLIGGAGGDLLSGDGGVDTVSFAQDGAAVFVNLTLGRGYTNTSFGDTYFGIENVIGSSANDFIIGDTGENRLDGGDGDDILLGAFGADSLIGGAGNDWASYEENSGTVFVNLTLGRGYNNGAEGDTLEGIENLVGGLFDDFFIGDGNANRLNGGMGADTLLGAGGADVFMLTYAPGATSEYGNPNVDLILDFMTGEDKIQLAWSAFAGLSAGALPASAFYAGTTAHDADDRIIYDQATGKLWFDADGNGANAAVLFATLGESNHPDITANDFAVA